MPKPALKSPPLEQKVPVEGTTALGSREEREAHPQAVGWIHSHGEQLSGGPCWSLSPTHRTQKFNIKSPGQDVPHFLNLLSYSLEDLCIAPEWISIFWCSLYLINATQIRPRTKQLRKALAFSLLDPECSVHLQL